MIPILLTFKVQHLPAFRKLIALFSLLHSVDEQYYDKMRNELVRQYLVIRPLMR